MKIDFHQAERWFGEAIWFWANRYKNRLNTAEDLYHEILIRVVEHDWEERNTYSVNLERTIPVDPAHVLTFVRSRTIDMIRRERRAPTGDVPTFAVDRSQGDVDPPRMLRDMFPELNDADVTILVEIATPSARTIALATVEQDEAKRDARNGALRMNVNGAPRITQAHVARSLGVSTSRVALAVRRATALLEV